MAGNGEQRKPRGARTFDESMQTAPDALRSLNERLINETLRPPVLTKTAQYHAVDEAVAGRIADELERLRVELGVEPLRFLSVLRMYATGIVATAMQRGARGQMGMEPPPAVGRRDV